MSDLFTAVSRYAGNGAKSHDLSYDLKVLPVPTGSSFCIYKVLPVPTGSSFCIYKVLPVPRYIYIYIYKILLLTDFF